jgi:hypothetical protein
MSKPVKGVVGALFTLAGVILILCLPGGTVSVSGAPGPMWIAGAAALGLVSGLITGLSKQPGSGQAFVTFVGAGILVPILGGVATLLVNTQVVTEKSKYSDTLLIEKSTETVTPHSDGFLHPLAVLGSFFIAFALLAVLGVVGGVLLRDSGALEVKLHE